MDKEKIHKAIYIAMEHGVTPKDEARFARIEALLRDALEQDHNVWEWRVGSSLTGMAD